MFFEKQRFERAMAGLMPYIFERCENVYTGGTEDYIVKCTLDGTVVYADGDADDIFIFARELGKNGVTLKNSEVRFGWSERVYNMWLEGKAPKKPDLPEYTYAQMAHIAGNFAINCMKGYDGSFNDWFKNIAPNWKDYVKKD